MKNLFMILLAIVIFNGCTKEGATGPAGKNGNANVSTSIFSAGSTGNWTQKTGTNIWVTSFIVPQFNQTVVGAGAVMVYIGSGAYNNPSWTAIPCDINGTDFSFTVTLGGLEVDAFMSTGQLPPNPGLDLNHGAFKVVIIPPPMIQAHPHLNLKDYNAVAEAFKLH